MSFLSDFFKISEKENQPIKNKSDYKPVGNVDDYFDSLITEDSFPGYRIERNVHAKVFDENAHPCCYPITYLFFKNNKPVLAVFLMNSNQYRAMISKGSYQVLESHGIKYIRFFRNCKNERDYVINRIKENLFWFENLIMKERQRECLAPVGNQA